MKTIAETFHVSRSNLIERVERKKSAVRSYSKAEDALLLQLIHELFGKRPTYSYRGIIA